MSKMIFNLECGSLLPLSRAAASRRTPLGCRGDGVVFFRCSWRKTKETAFVLERCCEQTPRDAQEKPVCDMTVSRAAFVFVTLVRSSNRPIVVL